MDLTGRIIAVLPAQSGVSQRTGNPWMSQDYVLVKLDIELLDAVFAEDAEHALAGIGAGDFDYILLAHPRIASASGNAAVRWKDGNDFSC